MPTAISDTGIVLHQTRFGEADKFVKILTANHGLLEVVAKGARRLTSKKSSHLDNLNLIRFQTSRGESPQYLLQIEAITTFRGIKSNLKKIRTCFYLTEILHQTLAENEIDGGLFFALKSFLEQLESSGDAAASRELAVKFQRYLISRLGFPPPKSNEPTALVAYFESLIDRPLLSASLKIG